LIRESLWPPSCIPYSSPSWERFKPDDSKESTQGDMTAQVWPARHDLSVVDYKALIGLSLMWVPHFRARHGASLKDLNLNTTSASKAKCFLVSR
jgi:hypothetical protein